MEMIQISTQPFFSIVVPVYNTERYLRNTVESICSQSFNNIEIILVDDCSTDESGSVCDALAAEDARISVIHAPVNRGLSETRNVGIQKAQGIFVLFMDSDDTLEPGLFEKANSFLQERPTQMLIFGMIEDYYNKDGILCRSYPVNYKECYFTKTDDIRNEMIYIEKSTLLGYAWNKFYNMDFIRKHALAFENVTLIEDIVFNVEAFRHLELLGIIDFLGYHYNKRINQSLTGKFVPDYFDLHRRRIHEIYSCYETWQLQSDKEHEILGDLYIRYIFSALQRNCDPRADMKHQDRKQWLERLYQDELFQKLIPAAGTEGLLTRIMCTLLKKRRTLWLLFIARIIYIVKNKMPLLFSALKRKG